MSDPEEDRESATEVGESDVSPTTTTGNSGEPTSTESKPPAKESSTHSKGKDTEGFITKNQQIFLVEFLIDTVNIDPEGFCDELMEGQTCVTLRFLNFPPMVICEKDFDPGKEHGIDRVQFNSGKSLMFAFTEKQCDDPPPMVADLTVSKKCPEGSEKETVDLGRIKVCMAQLFQQVYDVAKFTPEKLPTSRSIKDCFMLIGKGKRTTGEVGVYIRLTCLGQNVVTEFQCGSNMKQDPILFKNREGKRVYQFTGADRNEEEYGEEPPYRAGCGCVGPPPPQKYPGGQGDAGRSPPSRRNTATGGRFNKGGRVVLDIPAKGNPCQGDGNVERYKKSTNKSADIQVTQDGQKSKVGSVAPQGETNPDQNCFVLKVGDKGQIPDRGKMILEFKAPKQKILPKILPPYHEDIAVQTDTPKKGKGKGKGKGKKK